MIKAGGMWTKQRHLYEGAREELRRKHFLLHLPDREDPVEHPEVHQLPLMPDYIDGYIPVPDNFERTPLVMKQLGRGYIQVPRKLAKDSALFHQAINDRSIPEGVYVWAVVIKLYQHYHLMIHGGVDPNVLRIRRGEFWMHPSLYEDLCMPREQFMLYFEYLQSHDYLEFVPVQCRETDIVGTEQLHYQRDDGEGNIQVARLRYNDYTQHYEWRRKNRVR